MSSNHAIYILHTVHLQFTCICMSSCSVSAPWDRTRNRLKDTTICQSCAWIFFFIPSNLQSHSILPIVQYVDTCCLHIYVDMASREHEGKEGVIEIVTDGFDKVGYTKADEADMAKQSKKQQFHVSLTSDASSTHLRF